MNMLQTHEKSLESSNVAYHEFLLIYKIDQKIVYGIIEGKEDSSFYRGLIENSLPQDWKVDFIKAGNKVSAIKAYEAFDWERFPKQRICFFIDRDLSIFTAESSLSYTNVYITDGYSIENEVLNINTLQRVLEEVLNVTELTSEEFNFIGKIFTNSKTYFSESLVPIMAQIIIWKRSGERPCLENLKMKELFDFDKGVISLKSPFKTKESRLNYAAKKCKIGICEPEELDKAENEFLNKDGHNKYIRGKYMLWFFIQFASNIHDSITNYCAKHKIKPKAKLNLGQNNAMTIIGPRIRIPDSLRIFIAKNYLNYINEVYPSVRP